VTDYGKHFIYHTIAVYAKDTGPYSYAMTGKK